eukprot:TRINITY_DN4316_c0_g1_i1.p1 TRINITY_DN4316_c0_g1~~TRINITY_DN4316_c0_g1_i1.p1  ORF type:complete len:199 (+),score=47.12 TRINITY_DN4316_c0_g1_i1:34-597(+)
MAADRVSNEDIPVRRCTSEDSQHRRTQSTGAESHQRKLSRSKAYPFSDKHLVAHESYLKSGGYIVDDFTEHLVNNLLPADESIPKVSRTNSVDMSEEEFEIVEEKLASSGKQLAKPCVLEKRKKGLHNRSKSGPILLTQIESVPERSEPEPIIETQPIDIPTPVSTAEKKVKISDRIKHILKSKPKE